MLKPWGFATLLLVLAAPALAQVEENPTPPQPTPTTQQPTPAPKPPRVFPRFDISAGYSYETYKPASGGPTVHLQGWYGDVVYNVFSWAGAEAQGAGDYGKYFSGIFGSPPNETGHISIYTFLAGPRIYPLRHHKLEPWAHALFGGAVYHDFYPAGTGFPSIAYTYVGKALEAGGGFDLNEWTHWGIRVFEFDYVKTQFGGAYNKPGYRLALGVTYRFGEK